MKKLRCIPAAAAALVLISASFVPDDAFARGGRGGGGGRAGGFHGGGVHAGRVAGGARPSHPIAGRPGYAGRPIAGRPGYAGGYYPGRGVAYGAAAAAAGAAAYGAYGAYNNGYYNNTSCYYDTSGRWVCPNQYPYRY